MSVTSTVEDAIYDWVVAGSELDEAQVIWAEERGPQPQGCYISMRIGDERSFGGDWVRQSEPDGSDEDPTMIMYTATGVRVLKLTLECFAAGDAWSTARPAARLARVLAVRRLPSIAEALSAARVGIGPITPVQVLELERAKIFEPRAQVEITLHLISEVSELVPSIDTVEIVPTFDEITSPTIEVSRPEDE